MVQIKLTMSEARLLKDVLHAIYKTFRNDREAGSGSSQINNLTWKDIRCIIEMHDEIEGKLFQQ